MDRMSDRYMDCIWKEYIKETVLNHNYILHQHGIVMMVISIALKVINKT